jgi:ribonuclease HI
MEKNVKINTRPLEIRRESMTNKEITKSMINNTALATQIRQKIATNTPELRNNSTWMEQKINEQRNFFKKLDLDHTTMNQQKPKLKIYPTLEQEITNKTNFNTETLRQMALSTIRNSGYRTKIYTDASQLEGKIGVGIFSDDPTLQLNASHQIKEQISVTSAELFAIFIAIEHLGNSEVEKAAILTDSRSACFILKNTLEGNEENKIAVRIINIIKNNNKEVAVRWIPGHVGLAGNEEADRLAKEGTTADEIEYKLQWVDAKAAIDRKKRQQWNTNYQHKSTTKGTAFYGICSEIPDKPWYKKSKMTNQHIRTLNRVFTTHTFTKDRLFIMKVSDTNSCDLCGVVEDINHVLYNCQKYGGARSQTPCLENHTPIGQIYQQKNTEEMTDITKFLEKIKYMA